MRGLLAVLLWTIASPVPAQAVDQTAELPIAGNAERGRLVFFQCRACHYTEAFMGHNNGPNLHRIFGKVAGKQAGFDHYSDTFREAEFVWTPRLMFAWLEDPMGMFPDTTMMSHGVPDPGRRADLVEFLKKASVRAEP